VTSSLTDTEIRILSTVYDGKSRPAEIARTVGMSLQGTIYHLRNIQKAGLIDENHRITTKGYEILYESLRAIRDRIGKTLSELEGTRTWEALCSSDVRQGDDVYLYMDGGYLHCSRTRVSSARGRSTLTGAGGSVTGVEEVSGIVEVDIRTVQIIILPDPDRGCRLENIVEGTAAVMKNMHDYEVFVLGEMALYVVRQIGITEPSSFAPLEAAYDAASRGLRSVVVSSRRRFLYESRKLEELARKYPVVKNYLLSV
jgi:predicted transcriptional regulator